MDSNQLAKQLINHFDASNHQPMIEDVLNCADKYVSEWREYYPEVIHVALNKVRQFLDRYESSEAMKNYYASFGRGEAYYSNMLLLEGALID